MRKTSVGTEQCAAERRDEKQRNERARPGPFSGVVRASTIADLIDPVWGNHRLSRDRNETAVICGIDLRQAIRNG